MNTAISEPARVGLDTRQGRPLLWLLAILWLLGGIFTLFLYAATARSPGMLRTGDRAPLFVLADQFGHTHRLENYAGRGVVVTFFPGTDEDSLRQLRSLNASIKDFDAIGVKVFAITPLKPEVTRPLYEKEHFSYPLLTDNQGTVGKSYGITFGPDGSGRVSYVIGPNSKILLPVREVQVRQHGAQLLDMTACCLDNRPQPPSLYLGKKIVDFSLPRVSDGANETLFGDRAQKATVLFFLSAHCPCSQQYNDRMREIARYFAAKGVRFLGINSAADENVAEVSAHAAKHGFPFPILKDVGNRIADRIGARITPEVFVLDESGVLRYHGRIDDSRDPTTVTSNDLQNALDALLAHRLPARADRPAFGCAISRDPGTGESYVPATPAR